jgi:hypothetical protein
MDETWTWTAGAVMYQKVWASDYNTNDEFGFSVSISGDYAIVGARNNGAAYIFYRSGGVWAEQQKLTGGIDFGSSVGICGDYAIVGRPDIGSGGAYIYVRSGVTWTLQKILNQPPPGAYFFGKSVSIGVDRVIVGSEAGAYVYVRSGTTWSLEKNFGIVTGFFGDQVFCDYNFNNVIIGQPRVSTYCSIGGAAYIYKRTGSTYSLDEIIYGTEPNQRFGNRVCIKDADAFISALYKCFAYVDVGTWNKQQTFSLGQPTVGVDGDIALIGLRFAGYGKVYIYIRVAGVWTNVQILLPDAGGTAYQFGQDLQIDKNDYNNVIISASKEKVGTKVAAGCVYFYKTEN